jgi:integrase
MRGLDSATNMKDSSKGYRRDCVKKLQTTWPELWDLTIEEITPEACQEWGAKLNKEINGQYFNNMLGTLRMVIAAGIAEHKRKTKTTLANPAMEVKRVKLKPTDLKLPTPEKFDELINNLRKESGGWGPRVADLAEFLAYSGMRIYSEALWITWNDVDWQHREIVVRGEPSPKHFC